MFKKIISSTLLVAAFMLGAVALVPTSVYAVDTKTEINKGITAAGGDTTKTNELTTLITNITNVLLFIAGAVAVIMIIVGAIRYVTSNGDQADVKAAKDTIMYSVVGLIVASLAYAIVNFVVSNL